MSERISAVAAPWGSMGLCPEGTAGAFVAGAVGTVVGCCCGCAALGESGSGAGAPARAVLAMGSACVLPGTGSLRGLLRPGLMSVVRASAKCSALVAGWDCCAIAAGTPVSAAAKPALTTCAQSCESAFHGEPPTSFVELRGRWRRALRRSRAAGVQRPPRGLADVAEPVVEIAPETRKVGTVPTRFRHLGRISRNRDSARRSARGESSSAAVTR